MLVKVMIFHTLLYITAHPRKKQNGRDYFCAVFSKPSQIVQLQHGATGCTKKVTDRQKTGGIATTTAEYSIVMLS